MKIARTIGSLTLSKSHPALAHAKLRLVEELDKIERIDVEPLGGETIVCWDLCGTGIGDLVALAEGPEAAQPFMPDVKPLDATIVALLDRVELG